MQSDWRTQQGLFQRKVALALVARAPQEVDARIVEIGARTVYNQELDDTSPSWRRFREQVCVRRGPFVTPEYNRSIPECPKNAIDIGSRPAGKHLDRHTRRCRERDALQARRVRGQPRTAANVRFLDMPALQHPELYIGGAGELFDDKGTVKNKDTDKLLRHFMETFPDFALRNVQAAATSFDAFLEERKTAAAAYVRGDAEPVLSMDTEQEPASFFQSNSPVVQGAAAVRKRYAYRRENLRRGRREHTGDPPLRGSGMLGYWTDIQRATAAVKGSECK